MSGYLDFQVFVLDGAEVAKAKTAFGFDDDRDAKVRCRRLFQDRLHRSQERESVTLGHFEDELIVDLDKEAGPNCWHTGWAGSIISYNGTPPVDANKKSITCRQARVCPPFRAANVRR